MDPIIGIKNVGKKYSIAHQKGRYVALRDIFTYIIKSPLKFAESKSKKIIGLETKEEFWALRNISFEINKGDVIGIIGANGAGKSTLLKILTGITPPTEGEIIMRGRVASLLEVGTGFHPELTGRENIFLNGAILGMSRRDLAKNFNAIVKFSGIEKFLDTPVKYYSSGMYVRLAFSVAAHMEPDILLVDEVLAVGDIEFQKKCLGKMEEVTEKEGRTILFVSHNMGAIERLCSKTILLEHGTIKAFGPTKDVINKYLGKDSGKSLSILDFPVDTRKDMQVTKVSLVDSGGKTSADLSMQKPFIIEIEHSVKQKINGAILSISIFTQDGQMILRSDSFDYTETPAEPFAPGNHRTKIHIPAHLLNVGNYYFDVLLHVPMTANFDHQQNIQFSIHDEGSLKGQMYNQIYQGIVAMPLRYETEVLS